MNTSPQSRAHGMRWSGAAASQVPPIVMAMIATTTASLRRGAPARAMWSGPILSPPRWRGVPAIRVTSATPRASVAGAAGRRAPSRPEPRAGVTQAGRAGEPKLGAAILGAALGTRGRDDLHADLAADARRHRHPVAANLLVEHAVRAIGPNAQQP